MTHTPGTSSAPRRAAAVGVFVNIALAGAKLVAGLLGNSYALIADAAESLADIVGSVIIWGGLRWAAVPADEDHPYGHGKAEALAALAVGVIILMAAAGIGVESVHGMFSAREAPHAWTLIVLGVVVVVKETLFRVVRSISEASGSRAAEADAWHHRVDAVTSLAAAVGIGASLLGGERWAYADNWAALLASGFIAFNGVSLIRKPWHDLMDRVPDGVTGAARDAAMRVEGVRGVEKVFARTSGSVYYLDMHVEVDPAMSVADAHVVSGKVKARVRSDVPRVANVLIHIEPHAPGGA